MGRKALLYLLVSALFLVISTTTYAATSYAILDLGFMGTITRAYGINNSGEIVGYYEDSAMYRHAWVWRNGAFTELHTTSMRHSEATCINNNGLIAGNSTPSSGYDAHATTWQNSVPTDQHGWPYYPYNYLSNSSYADVNDAGLTVGNATSGWHGSQAFVGGGIQTTWLSKLEGDNSCSAYGINNNGQIVGNSEYVGSTPGDVTRRACIWSASGNITQIGPLGVDSSAVDVNNACQVVGSYDVSVNNVHAFLWQNNQMRDLGAIGGDWSTASAINNSGVVVGNTKISSTLSYTHAFYWTESTGMVDLGALSGGSKSMAYDINDYGVIVGTATDANGRWHAVAWTPVPEPSSLVTLLCGIGGVGGMIWRRRK